ncbi:DUF2533 family protein [Anaerobacillus sp. HL2]|nr:DUF2533 family protein [Anaerobacillus sp. HL2]
MSVHLQIKKQMNNFIKQKGNIKNSINCVNKKELRVLIDAKNKDFSLLEVTAITEELNNLNKSYGFPLRKQVSKIWSSNF